MTPSKQALMEVNGLKAVLNTPPALTGEGLNKLPPGAARPAYVVDEYKACPNNWEHGSSKASSYFIPVEAGKGLWFDFTANEAHKHHVAVVMSVQGINPVTNKKMTALNLVQHGDNCPIHDIPFEQDRFCPHEECRFKWPAQNYIATTCTKRLWFDGFRGEDNEVRQYILTEEEVRGVAAQIIKNQRVFAIGFAFYLSKEPKPVPPPSPMRMACFDGGTTKCVMPAANKSYMFDSGGDEAVYGCCADDNDGLDMAELESLADDLKGAIGTKGMTGKTGPGGPIGPTGNTGPQGPAGSKGASGNCGQSVQRRGGVDRRMAQKVTAKAPKVKKLEIGAGARIKQDVGVDTNPIDFWQPEPAGLIYINYVTQEEADRIISEGKREEAQDGSLDGLKVGN